jgi:hypothetical protein
VHYERTCTLVASVVRHLVQPSSGRECELQLARTSGLRRVYTTSSAKYRVQTYRYTAGPWRPADEKLVKKALSDAQPGAQTVSNASATVLLGQTVEQLQQLVVDQFGQPKYRGKQLHDALFHGVTSVHDLKQVLFNPFYQNHLILSFGSARYNS